MRTSGRRRRADAAAAAQLADPSLLRRSWFSRTSSRNRSTAGSVISRRRRELVQSGGSKLIGDLARPGTAAALVCSKRRAGCYRGRGSCWSLPRETRSVRSYLGPYYRSNSTATQGCSTAGFAIRLSRSPARSAASLAAVESPGTAPAGGRRSCSRKRRDPCASSSRRRPGRSRTAGPGSSARCPRARPGARRAKGSRQQVSLARDGPARRSRISAACSRVFVLVVLRVLEHGAVALRGGAAPSGAPPRPPCRASQFVDRYDPTLAQQFDQRVQGR